MTTIKDVLISQGPMTEQQFADATEKAKQENISLMHAIELIDAIPEERVLAIFSTYYRIQATSLKDKDVPKNIIDLIPSDLAVKLRVIPLDRVGNNIIVAMGDPLNLKTIDTIRFSVGFFARPVLASEMRITEALEKYYGKVLDIHQVKDERITQLQNAKDDGRHKITAGGKGDGPIIKLVNDVIVQCIRRRGSDVHIEPYESYMRIRIRTDGVLMELAHPPRNMLSALISRIKIMAGLNIAETRLPQDGAINITVDGNPIDFRVSSIPSVHGEKIVMRLLDKSALKVDMTQLGFDQAQLNLFQKSIHQPYGMILVTGPTGSGKTTTLYSALQELNRKESNIMTAEDPVEYSIEGINQVQMKHDIGLNFAAALRSFLRQDPDIIMVGEIRDLETAEIAVKASLTGHLVLSTLHTNNAPDAISRLLNMGIESFNLISALTAITAQRLMRKICTRCRVVDEAVTPQILISLGIHSSFAEKVKAYKGQGCPACNNQGNTGRIGVHEVLVLNEQVKQAILDNASSIQLKKIAMASGMLTLRQSALNKLMQGVVSATEVVKVTASDQNQENHIQSIAS
jgi:type IV pilus assembly protein PilB